MANPSGAVGFSTPATLSLLPAPLTDRLIEPTGAMLGFAKLTVKPPATARVSPAASSNEPLSPAPEGPNNRFALLAAN